MRTVCVLFFYYRYGGEGGREGGREEGGTEGELLLGGLCHPNGW